MGKLNIYESPALEAIYLTVEQGFAQSSANEPNWDGFDNEQQW